MANICDVHMLIRGRKDCVQEFCKILQNNYNYYNTNDDCDVNQRHFYRLGDVYIDTYDINYSQSIADAMFECAWSAYCCLMYGIHSYYNDNHMSPNQMALNDNNLYFDTQEQKKYPDWYAFPAVVQPFKDSRWASNATNLLIESHRLCLEIELWSYEPGMAFQEHLFVSNGYVIIDETYENLHSFDVEDCPTLETYRKIHGDVGFEGWTEDQYQFEYEAQGGIIINYGEEPERYNIDFKPPKYLCHKIMAQNKSSDAPPFDYSKLYRKRHHIQ